MKLVVDASVAVKWYLPEVHSLRAGRLLDPRFSLVAPDLIRLEVGNVLEQRVRRHELTFEEAAIRFESFETGGAKILPSIDLVQMAFEMAMELSCTIYDCLYLALAVDEECMLLTADRKFYTAVAKSELAPYILWIEDL